MTSVVNGLLYVAAAVQQWLAQQCVCATTVGAATMDVTCASGGVSNRVWLSVGTLDGRAVLSRDTPSDVCGIKRDGVRH